MIDYDTGGIHTAHTTNPVPLILLDDEHKAANLRPGTAIDVAPTILRLWGMAQPREMTGRSLLP
jgi:2,3-bisphosphoglycerate-independent phosphoglycerate mutase